jgi:hypothetical protein
MCWATFWSIFSQTHLVTLLRSDPLSAYCHQKNYKRLRQKKNVFVNVVDFLQLLYFCFFQLPLDTGINPEH